MKHVTLRHHDGANDMAFELRPTRGRRKREEPLSLSFEWMEGRNADGMTVTRPLALHDLARIKTMVDAALEVHHGALRLSADRSGPPGRAYLTVFRRFRVVQWKRE